MQRYEYVMAKPKRLAALSFLLCIVCAPSANSQVRFFRVYEQVHTLTKQSLHQELLGNKGLALENILAAQQLVKENEYQFSELERNRLSDIVKNLSNTSNTNNSVTLRPSFDWILKSLDPLSDAKRSQAGLPRLRNSVARVAEQAFRVVPKPVVVTADVSRFSSEFRKGARDYNATFSSEKRSAPVFGTAGVGLNSFDSNSDLIDRWMAAPREKRIFFTGARSDATYAQLIRERYASGGFQIFFYQDCRPLCDEATVGAFFGSSGEVIHIDSPNAALSLFAPIEVGLIAELQGTGRRLFIIDSSEFDHIETVGKLTITAVLIVCTTDTVLNKDSICLQFLQ